MCLHAMYLFSDFGELVEEADLIIIGYVYCGKTAETGAEYGIVIKEILKGNTENMQISATQKYGIKIGTDYLFLLKKTGSGYTDFFEGMSHFEIEYTEYKTALTYCISIPTKMIGVKDFEIAGEADISHNGKLWKPYYYPINYIKKYIGKVTGKAVS